MIRSAAWLRRFAMGLVMLGMAQIVSTYPMLKTVWKGLPLETLLMGLWSHLAAGLWVAGSGMLLGMMAEASKDPEVEWPGPLARGVANFLLAGGILAPALMWRNPFAWILAVLATGTWWASRKKA
ncbi:MAG: hypothetical protein AAB214_12775 [Fibrobacterota bacterium]